MNKALTNSEADVVIASYADSYGNWWNEIYEKDMRKVLTTEPRRSYQNVADVARERVWTWFSGGGASANATRRAFALVGREDECRKDWC